MTLNKYFWLILVSQVGFHLLDVLANLLNARSLRRELPDEFRGVYDEKEYRRLLDYTAATSRFELIQSSFMLLVLLAFWFGGGYGWLDRLVRAAQFGAIESGLIFIGVLWLGRTLTGLPFEIYDTFVIEERFGFNKATPAVFVADRLKSLGLGVALGGPLIALILVLFERGGPWVWLQAWAALAVLLFVMAYLAPALILPLFNKFTPLEAGELKQRIMEFAAREKFPISGVFVMDGSKRSTKSNAFFTGFGRTKKIVLFDTLIANHTTPELLAVLAHEIAHYKLRHIPQHLAVAIMNIGIFLALASHFVHAPGLFSAFGIQQPSISAGLALFLLIYHPISRVLHILHSFQSRRHEFAADRFAAEKTGQPEAMSSALKTLSKTNLANLTPHPLQVVLYHSHPPVLERIHALAR